MSRRSLSDGATCCHNGRRDLRTAVFLEDSNGKVSETNVEVEFDLSLVIVLAERNLSGTNSSEVPVEFPHLHRLEGWHQGTGSGVQGKR